MDTSADSFTELESKLIELANLNAPSSRSISFRPRRI